MNAYSSFVLLTKVTEVSYEPTRKGHPLSLQGYGILIRHYGLHPPRSLHIATTRIVPNAGLAVLVLTFFPYRKFTILPCHNFGNVSSSSIPTSDYLFETFFIVLDMLRSSIVKHSMLGWEVFRTDLI